MFEKFYKGASSTEHLSQNAIEEQLQGSTVHNALNKLPPFPTVHSYYLSTHKSKAVGRA